MRYWCVLALGLVLAVGVKGQGFSKRIVGTRPAMQYASIIHKDSTFYTLGVSTRMTAPYKAKTMWSRLSEDGTLQDYTVYEDTNTFAYGGFFNSLVVEGDSLIKLFSYEETDTALYPVLFTIGLDGTLKRKTTFLNSLSTFMRGDYITCDAKGNCYLACNFQYVNGNVDCRIIKVNDNDSVIWQNNYGVPNGDWWEIPSSIAVLKNGNILIGANKFEQYTLPNMQSYAWIFELDKNGALIRQWFDSGNTWDANALRQTKDGGFIYATETITEQNIGDVLGHSTIVKLDSLFALQWEWNGTMKMGSLAGITDIEEIPGGGFIACGNGNYVNPNYNLASAHVIKLDALGNVVWSKGYTALDTTGAYNILNDIDVLPDGSYIAVGYVNIPSAIQPTQRQQAWILKVDSNGCMIENCLVGIDNELQTADHGIIQLYPNPANSNVQVMLGNEFTGGSLKLYNPTGALVKQVEVESSTTTIDVSTLPKGLYFVAAEKDGVNASRRLIVE